MPPRIIIYTNSDLDSAFEQIRAQADAKFHDYHPHFRDAYLSERELGDLETYARYAEHGGDHPVNGIHK